jgi:hypothetical protein
MGETTIRQPQVHRLVEKDFENPTTFSQAIEQAQSKVLGSTAAATIRRRAQLRLGASGVLSC